MPIDRYKMIHAVAGQRAVHGYHSIRIRCSRCKEQKTRIFYIGMEAVCARCRAQHKKALKVERYKAHEKFTAEKAERRRIHLERVAAKALTALGARETEEPGNGAGDLMKEKAE